MKIATTVFGRRRRVATAAAVVCLFGALPPDAVAQEEEAQALAKSLSNPVADLVSLPMQFNWENGVGPNDAARFVMNFQPVVPFSLNEKWNLIGRWIMPYVAQPALAAGADPTSGLSDIIASAFFSPAQPSGVVWGIGPVFSLPTTTDPFLGSGKWSVGPTALVLKQSGPWTYGFLANHLWSVAGATNEDRADVNQTFLQPFVAYASPTGVTVALNSESSANWEAAEGEKWTVPINVMVNKITRLGPFPFQVGAGAGVYVASPDGGPEWKLRTQFVLILPRAR
jgi:hypothetical protein